MEEIFQFLRSNEGSFVVDGFTELLFIKLFKEGYVSIDNELLSSKKEAMNLNDTNSRVKRLMKPSIAEIKKLRHKESKIIEALVGLASAEHMSLTTNDTKIVLYWFFLIYDEEFINFIRGILIRCRCQIEFFFKQEGNFHWFSNVIFEDFECTYEKGILYQERKCSIDVVSNLDGLYNKVKELKEVKQNLRLFFRGHANINYLLEPSIQRSENFLKNEHLIFEESILENPEEFLYEKRNIDKLKKMQHYGLPTRLLDVTSNLLVAVYFSVSSFSDKDGEVIVFTEDSDKIAYSSSKKISVLSSLARLSYEDKIKLYELSWDNSDLLSKNSGENSVSELVSKISEETGKLDTGIEPDNLKNSYFVLTKKDNRRIQKQDGAFICCSLNPYVKDDLNRYRGTNHYGKKVILVIPKDKKGEFRKQLEVFGIHEGTIYPEIEHVSAYLKKKYG